MQEEMSSARITLALTLLRSLAVGSTLIAAAVLPVGPAAAEEPGGTTVVGQLVQAWPEAASGEPAADGPMTWVQNSEGTAVRIPTGSVEGIPAGSTVQVTVGPGDGGTAEDPLHEVHGAQMVSPAAVDPVLRNPAGLTNQVTVVRVAPDGAARDGVTDQELVDLVDGPVADFWSEQSNGAIAVGVGTAVHDWVTPVAGCADPTAMWNEVAAAT